MSFSPLLLLILSCFGISLLSYRSDFVFCMQLSGKAPAPLLVQHTPPTLSAGLRSLVILHRPFLFRSYLGGMSGGGATNFSIMDRMAKRKAPLTSNLRLCSPPATYLGLYRVEARLNAVMGALEVYKGGQLQWSSAGD